MLVSGAGQQERERGTFAEMMVFGAVPAHPDGTTQHQAATNVREGRVERVMIFMGLGYASEG
jgi:hypothetical protein